MIRHLKRLIPQRSPLRLSWHKLKALIAAIIYRFPARKLLVIGVTGTDGKTTTVGMIAHILAFSGAKSAAISTAFFRIGDKISWNATQKTSPSPFIIQRFLRAAVKQGCTHAVIEYSSHGLVQGRSGWTWPSVAAITNTSLEHLDYHGSMEQYRKDKGLLFEMLDGKDSKVLHLEDDTYEMFLSFPSKHTIAYATHAPETFPPEKQGRQPDALLWISSVQADPHSSSALLRRRTLNAEDQLPLKLAVPGSFNLENALCAIGASMSVGISLSKACEALKTFQGIPGRMERIDAGQPFSVFIDFTVTPIAYERTLSALRSALPKDNRLLVLTGSCGDRMREKRPEIGKICSELAHVVVVTNEDPYTEDPEKIIDDVWSGIDTAKTQAFRMIDRKEAISFLFSQARAGDIVILCGKGSDTTMMLKDGQIPWNEREIARELLVKL